MGFFDWLAPAGSSRRRKKAKPPADPTKKKGYRNKVFRIGWETSPGAVTFTDRTYKTLGAAVEHARVEALDPGGFNARMYGRRPVKVWSQWDVYRHGRIYGLSELHVEAVISYQGK